MQQGLGSVTIRTAFAAPREALTGQPMSVDLLLCFMVFGLVDGVDLRMKVQGFRGGDRVKAYIWGMESIR